MSQPQSEPAAERLILVGPDGSPAEIPAQGDAEGDGSPVTELVEQPAMVLRIGSMIKQLLEEVRSAPLDDASRTRLREIHGSAITELEKGLAPELVAELRRITQPFSDDAVPSDAELRIAQAQLVGWLEGLFHGIQAAMFAQQQQIQARAQFEEMRRRALPPGMRPAPGAPGTDGQPGSSTGTGNYL